MSVVLTCCIKVYNSTQYSITFLHNNATLDINQTTSEYSLPNSTQKYIVEVLEQSAGHVQYNLTIANFSLDDAGEYTCQVGSQYRPVEQQRKVNVSVLVLNDVTVTPLTTGKLLQMGTLTTLVLFSPGVPGNTTASTTPLSTILGVVISTVVLIIVVLITVVVRIVIIKLHKCEQQQQQQQQQPPPRFVFGYFNVIEIKLTPI